MRFITIIYIILVFLSMVACQGAETPSPQAVPEMTLAVITIDIHQKYQVMENFGISGAWWAQEVGGWQEDNRQRIIRLLFDQQYGIGLSAYRYNIGAGGGGEINDLWRKTDSFEVSSGIYDWTRDANAVKILKMAHDAGVEQFIAFSNSPPPRLTRSGMVSGGINGESNLGPNQEYAFAKYLVDIVRHLQVDEGIPVEWLSPINEPQWAWSISNNQEGSHYTPAEAAYLIQTLIKYIDEVGLEIKILAPESGQWANNEGYWNALFEVANLDVFAVHSYASENPERTAFPQFASQQQPATRIWMTEWVEMQTGRDTGMDSALTMAQTIHDDITLGNVTAWQYWIAVSKYDYHDGLIYINPGSQIPIETKRLWAFGNFSRFIRPGYQRILANSDQPGFSVSAYISTDENSVIVVAINHNPNPVPASISMSGSQWLGFSSYETSMEHNLRPGLRGVTTQGYTFPARSITTLVISP